MSVNSNSKHGSEHPFAKKDPKPTRARLVSLLDPLGRKRYSEVERFLATIPGATSGLFHYGNSWGWAVRYLIGTKNALCTLHLLPHQFEASVPLGKEMETLLKTVTLDPEMKRRLAKSQPVSGIKVMRTPIKNDHDYAGFQTFIKVRAESLKLKKPAKKEKTAAEPAPKKAAHVAAKPAAAKPAPKAPIKKAPVKKAVVKKPLAKAKTKAKTK